MDIKALQLTSRFSISPNALGYCGEDSAPAKLKKCIISGNSEGVEEEISKFIVLYPYLKTIAKITDLPIFSYPVIESYWLGNDQLKKVKMEDYDLLLENFIIQGVPDFLILELQQKRPQVFIPNHLFQILHVGVGRASGSVPFNITSINQCMIRWGKVTDITNDKLKVSLNSLKKEDGHYEVTIIEQTAPFNLAFVPGLKVGDTIAFHWGEVMKILTAGEEKNLSFWTKEVAESFTF